MTEIKCPCGQSLPVPNHDSYAIKCGVCGAKYVICQEQPPAPPKYRVFEMNAGNRFEVHHDRTWYRAAVGHQIGDYRVFGFTDNMDWKPTDDYSTVPCDLCKNFDYAIGRLEE